MPRVDYKPRRRWPLTLSDMIGFLTLGGLIWCGVSFWAVIPGDIANLKEHEKQYWVMLRNAETVNIQQSEQIVQLQRWIGEMNDRTRRIEQLLLDRQTGNLHTVYNQPPPETP